MYLLSKLHNLNKYDIVLAPRNPVENKVNIILPFLSLHSTREDETDKDHKSSENRGHRAQGGKQGEPATPSVTISI